MLNGHHEQQFYWQSTRFSLSLPLCWVSAEHDKARGAECELAGTLGRKWGVHGLDGIRTARNGLKEALEASQVTPNAHSEAAAHNSPSARGADCKGVDGPREHEDGGVGGGPVTIADLCKGVSCLGDEQEREKGEGAGGRGVDRLQAGGVGCLTWPRWLRPQQYSPFSRDSTQVCDAPEELAMATRSPGSPGTGPA